MNTETISIENVRFSTFVWSRAYAALQLVVMRERGAEGLTQLKYNFMNGHGRKHFLGGIRKLGLENEPPAVAAARYHYMGNDLIGDVPMEYVEESSKKVWIRYTAPAWAYPGSGMLAVPASTQLAAFQAWHRNNGTWLEAPRLGYVCTKLYQYGEPYDEGYFIEYDHDISIEQAFRYEPTTTSPSFDPATAPKLDPRIWPEARILKARRKYAESYVAVPARVLIDMYGAPYAAFLIKQAMRGLGTQYGKEIATRFDLTDRDAKAISTLMFKVLTTLGEAVSLERHGESFELTRSTFAPVHELEIEGVQDAHFGFYEGILRVLTANVSLQRHVDMSRGSRLEVWTFRNSQERLF